MTAGAFRLNPLNAYFQTVKEQTNYRHWFFGHYHSNMNLPDGEILIYEQIIRIL